MKKSGNIKPDPEELPLLSRKGICVFIQCAILIDLLLKELCRFFDEGHRLSREQDTQLMKKIASYVYFETVKQILAYHEGHLSTKDAHEVLDVAQSYFFRIYGLDNLRERLAEYYRSEDSIYAVGRNIVGTVTEAHDIEEIMDASIAITGAMPHVLFDGLSRMFELSEADMAELIEDFFVNNPRMTEQG